jgi:hypothetical protein
MSLFASAFEGGSAIGSLPSNWTILVGAEWTNLDGVNVINDANSGGTARINPKYGDKDSKTSVVTKSGFKGSVSGLDSNDTTDIGATNTVTINTDGGTVNIAGGSTATVNNANNGNNCHVTLPSGGSVDLPPGSSAVFHT